MKEKEQQLFDQAVVELYKAMRLAHTAKQHRLPSHDSDVAVLLAGVLNTMRALEKELHARASN